MNKGLLLYIFIFLIITIGLIINFHKKHSKISRILNENLIKINLFLPFSFYFKLIDLINTTNNRTKQDELKKLKNQYDTSILVMIVFFIVGILILSLLISG